MKRTRSASREIALLSVAGLLLMTVLIGRPAAEQQAQPMKANRPVSTTSTPPSLPVAFAPNYGQWPDSVLFRADDGGVTMWLTRNRVYYQVSQFVTPEPKPSEQTPGHRAFVPGDHEGRERVITTQVAMEFVGSSPRVVLRGEDELEYRFNYFLGSDPAHWRTAVPNYAQVVLENLYPGIDVVYTGKNGRLESQIVSREGADLSKLRVTFAGADNVSVDPEGTLQINTPLGDIGGVLPAGMRFEPLGGNNFSMQVDSRGYRAATSAYSVFVAYATCLGGTGLDKATQMAIDSVGNAYVGGFTASADFPTVNPYQTDTIAYDGFVVKLAADGGSLIYGTYLGGNGNDFINNLDFDSLGYCYLVGATASTDFPTVNPYQLAQGGSDAFVAKLTPTGDDLVFSTYLGGPSDDVGIAVSLDVAGNICVSATSYGAGFPLVSEYQDYQGSTDAVACILNETGSDLIFSTYLGGTLDDYGAAMEVDATGKIYIVGTTYSDDFPTKDPYQTLPGSGDAFIVRFGASGSSFEYGTYLGGTGEDLVWSLSLDPSGDVWVSGFTSSEDLPVATPYQSFQGGGYDAFVVRLNTKTNVLVYGTYLGGTGDDQAYGLGVDAAGTIHMVGYTTSADFPVMNSVQPYMGGGDAFILRFATSTDSLEFSTFLGGTNLELVAGFALTLSRSIYLVGQTRSADFPTVNPYQTYQGGGDGFVARFDPVFEDVQDPLLVLLVSPIDMVVIDPYGDSIGLGFNTIGAGSYYDSLTDYNSDGEPDDAAVIPSPFSGHYAVRLRAREDTTSGDKFSLSIRINGNQLLDPEAYQNQLVSALGNDVSATYVYTTATTLPGDANADGVTTSADIIYLVNYVFKGGTDPVVPGHGDVNCDGAVTSADIIYLVNYVFKSGTAPCSQTVE